MVLAVACLLVCLFGIVAVRSVPVQMTPDMDRPVITVVTDAPRDADAGRDTEADDDSGAPGPSGPVPAGISPRTLESTLEMLLFYAKSTKPHHRWQRASTAVLPPTIGALEEERITTR